MITRHLRTHNRFETQESSGVSSMDDSMSSSRLEATRSISTESESTGNDISIRLSREASCDTRAASIDITDTAAVQLSFDGSGEQQQQNRLSREFSESRLSRDFSENRLSFDLTEGRFLGEKAPPAETFSSQSSRDFPDNQQLVEERLDRESSGEPEKPEKPGKPGGNS